MEQCTTCGRSALTTQVDDTYVGVRFAEEAHVTLCTTPGESLGQGADVVVDLEGEAAYGRVEDSPATVFRPCQKAKARPIVRRATDADRQAYQHQRENEVLAKLFCQERSRALKLEMKISRISFALSGRRAAVHFSAEGRVDFRQLVREFSQRFSARVQMVQVGARDESRAVGGVGVCGMPLCCACWMSEFKPISIQMAKRQSLSLNPTKISGQCGRLLCCLAHEDEGYKRGGDRAAAPLPVVS